MSGFQKGLVNASAECSFHQPGGHAQDGANGRDAPMYGTTRRYMSAVLWNLASAVRLDRRGVLIGYGTESSMFTLGEGRLPVVDGRDPRVARILDIVAAETDIPRASLVLDAKIDDLGISSLDLTLAIFKLETAFDVEIPAVLERAGSEFGTVGELVAHVIAVLDTAAPMPAEG
jgi:acyl carrier protein